MPPRLLRISPRRSASSSFAWQKRESCTPRSNSASDLSSARSPSSSVLTIVSSSAMADSKSLMVGSMSFYPAVDLAVGQCHVDAIPRRDAGGAADDRGALLVPAHSIAATEYGEGAEILEASGEGAEARVGAQARALGRRGEARVGAAEAAAHRGEMPRQVALLEPL